MTDVPGGASDEKPPQPASTSDRPNVEVDNGFVELKDAQSSISDEALHKAASQSLRIALECREIGPSPEDQSAGIIRQSESEGATNMLAVNNSFLCYVDGAGSTVHVVSQASMEWIGKVCSPEGALVTDISVQQEDSHLLSTFADGRVFLSRLTSTDVTNRAMLHLKDQPAHGVLWHPTNQRLFATLHKQRCLLWHLPKIMQFCTLMPPGYKKLEEEGVNTAMEVSEELVKDAACELELPAIPSQSSLRLLHSLLNGGDGTDAQPPKTEESKPVSSLAFTLDGSFFALSFHKEVLLWQVQLKDEQEMPKIDRVQRMELPHDLAAVTHMRFAPRQAYRDGKDSSMLYWLVVAAKQDILFYTFDSRPSGGSGSWMPLGKLICPLSQRLSFTHGISSDVFVSWDAEIHSPRSTPKLVFFSQARDESPLLCVASIDDNDVPVTKIATVSCPSRFVALRAFERASRPKAIPDSIESHDWAIIGLQAVVDSKTAGAILCCCAAKSEDKSSPQGLSAAQPSTAPESFETSISEGNGIVNQPATAAVDDKLEATVAEEDLGMLEEEDQEVGKKKKQISRDDLVNFTKFLRSRTQKADSKVLESVLENLRDSGKEPFHRGRIVLPPAGPLLRELSDLREDMQRTERLTPAALQKALDPALIKKCAKDALEKELGKWRDSVLPRSLLKGIETQAFADRFAEELMQVQKTNPQETSTLMETLRPTKQHIEAALRAELQPRFSVVVNKHLKTLLQENGSKVRGAMDAAMQEVVKQSLEAVERHFREEEEHGRETVSKLSDSVASEIRAMLQKEVRAFEERMRATGSDLSANDKSGLKQRFTQKLKVALEPLENELSAAASEIQNVKRTVDRVSSELEGNRTANDGQGTSTASEVSFDAVQAEVKSLIIQAQHEKALRMSLEWDAKHQNAHLGLAEWACDTLIGSMPPGCGSGLQGAITPEDCLGSWGSRLEENTKMLLMFNLLQRSVKDFTSLQRLEANLDWATTLQTVFDPDDNSVSEAIGPAVDQMTSMLEIIARAEKPPSLSQADAAARQMISQNARIALKAFRVMHRTKKPPPSHTPSTVSQWQ